jgi:hypothetical protein
MSMRKLMLDCLYRLPSGKAISPHKDSRIIRKLKFNLPDCA